MFESQEILEQLFCAVFGSGFQLHDKTSPFASPRHNAKGKALSVRTDFDVELAGRRDTPTLEITGVPSSRRRFRQQLLVADLSFRVSIENNRHCCTKIQWMLAVKCIQQKDIRAALKWFSLGAKRCQVGEAD
jgi:hypothetical protein